MSEKRKRKVLKRPDRVETKVREGGSRTVESPKSKTAGKKEGGKK